MRRKRLFVLVMLVLLPATVSLAVESGVPSRRAGAFVGRDLHLAGGEVISYQASTGEHILVFHGGFSMSISANQFFSDSAVVWLESIATEFRGPVHIDYKGRVYLEGDVSVKKDRGDKTTDLSQTIVEKGQAMVVRFSVSGEVFVTADRREITDPRGFELYKRALTAVVPVEPKFVVQPELPETKKGVEKAGKEVAAARPKKPAVIEIVVERKKPAKPSEVAAKPEAKEPVFRYPVNFAPASEVPLEFESAKAPDGTDIATVIGRLYVWQRQKVRGKEVFLELLADNAVIFSSLVARRSSPEEEKTQNDIFGKGAVRAIYMSGDVVMTEGHRTIRADEIYYDFDKKKAIAINAVMRNFDVSRGIPIYVRAAKLQQLAENKFTAENIALTSSEFYLPQISLSASSVIITDTTTIDAQVGQVSDSSYDAEMHDVRLKVYDKTIFYWPFMRGNLQRPDIPLKSMHTGYDGTWGVSVETRWHLARLLGLREPEGTESTFELDYYGKRGLGSGVEIDYARENYFGGLLGYVIHDSGEDRLGRYINRRDVAPPRELRGRFRWQHRHFLPYNWQLTAETSYASDERFIESYYRDEFNVDKEQETIVHLKRLEDNWAVSLLGKRRINDFADKLEELPSAEFHLTGQSLFGDRFTLYSDTQVSRLRQRIGDTHSTTISDEGFSFVSHRTELDMPVRAGSFKVVPFVAGTFGYDDRSGFTRTLVDGRNTGSFGEDKVWIGEAGVRVFPQAYWKVYPNVESRLLDLKGLRHIIKPQLTGVLFEESDSVVSQRDTLNVGISQRFQTKRGPAGKQRSVDWMRLDTDFTWVNNSGSAASSGPDRFIWNSPIVPLRVLSAPDIFHGDLTGVAPYPTNTFHRFEMFGPRRNYFSADYIWRVSDTTALLSDMNFDMQSGVVQQFNIGFSRLHWPNLSYYIGSRYLRRIMVLGERGSNAFTFAATYVLDPRYTVVFAQQFDFDYGANIRSEMTLIRRYHRVYCGLTLSVDESLDRQAIVFSIWPQGVSELAIGQRRYMGIGN